jgi:hypothetical protein
MLNKRGGRANAAAHLMILNPPKPKISTRSYDVNLARLSTPLGTSDALSPFLAVFYRMLQCKNQKSTGAQAEPSAMTRIFRSIRFCARPSPRRRPYQHLEQSTAGYDQTGRLMQVGGCCTALLKSIIAVSIYFAPAPPPRPWVEDGRLWFEAHPQRTHRLRRAHPDEGVEPSDCWIVVRQLEPGARQRLAVAMADQFNELLCGLDATEEIWEATARAIFDTLVLATERQA